MTQRFCGLELLFLTMSLCEVPSPADSRASQILVSYSRRSFTGGTFRKTYSPF